MTRDGLRRVLAFVAGQPMPARTTVVPDWSPSVAVRVDSLDLVHVTMRHSHSDRLVLSLVMPRTAADRLAQHLNRELGVHPPRGRKPR